jgi:hypothetical protein
MDDKSYKEEIKPEVVAHTCNSSTREVEVRVL